MWCCFLLSVSPVRVNVHEEDMQSWYKRLSTSFTNTFLVDNTIGNNYYIYGDLLLFLLSINVMILWKRENTFFHKFEMT